MNQPRLFRCGDFGGHSKGGELCRKPVIAGTQRCDMHSGKAREVAKAEGQITLEVRRWMLSGHSGADVRPGETLLQLIAFWSFKVNEVGRMLGEAIVAADRLREAHAAQQLLVAEGLDEDRDDNGEPPAIQAARLDLERVFTSGGVAALVGYRFDADRSGRVYAVEEGIRGLAKLDAEYSDRLARYCAMAETAKIAETQIAIARQQGEQMFAIFAGVLADLQLSAEQAAAVPRVLERHLRTLVPGLGRVIDGQAVGALGGGAR